MHLNPKLEQRAVQAILWIFTLITIFILFFIIFYILRKGLPVISSAFLTTNPTDMGKSGGIYSTIIGTIALTIGALIVATPLGVGTAIYLNEYTRESRITKVIRFGSECLAGIPSIIFGLFGFILFVTKLKMGWSILSGSLTMAFMLLPTIIRTSEEALKSVPYNYREVSYSLGGTKWQTVTKVVFPSALPGILTGIILSIGRSVGETAATIFTAGSALRMPTSVFSSSRSMAVHFYILAREGISMPNAYGTAAVLIITILFINIISYRMMHQFMKKYS